MELTLAAEQWKLRAAEQQQTFYTLFGDREWDKLDKKHSEFRDNMMLKISFALYARSYASCTYEHQNRIGSMIEKIQSLSDKSESIHIGYTFVSTWDEISDCIVPLIRVKGDDDKVYFVEADHAEIYHNWTEYLETNRLVYMDICYPKNGIYKRRPEGRVLVEYGKSCSLRKFRVYVDTQTSRPVTASLYFPFADSSNSLIRFAVHWCLTYVTVKKTLDFHQPIKDLDSLATWIHLICPAFGTVIKQEPYLTSVCLETIPVLKAIDYFKLFYDAPYTINGHFSVVHLMKMIAIRSTEKLNGQDLNKFSDMLKFIVNASFAQMCHVEKIVEILSDDNTRLNNIFDVVSNTPYQQIKEMEFMKSDDRCVTRVLDLITKSEPDSPLVSVARRIIVLLTNIAVKKKKTNCKEFGVLASNSIVPLKVQLYQAFMEETRTLREKLIDMLKNTIGSDEYLAQINCYPRDVLKVIFNCVNKVTAGLATPEIKNTFEKQFLKFGFDFSKKLPGLTEVGDVFLFLAGKFLVKCRAHFIEYESRTRILNSSDIEGIFYSFFAVLKTPSVVKELMDEYTDVCNICEKKIIYAPIIEYKGMCIKGRILQGMFDPFVFGVFCQETTRDYLGVKEIPENDRYSDIHVLVFKKDSKYVLNFSLFPPDLRAYFPLGPNSKLPSVIGISVTYELPSN